MLRAPRAFIASLSVVLLSLATGARDARAQPKRIYLAPDDHTDYMWTADEETYRLAFLEMIDFYLAEVDATASEPPEHQARWNLDGSYWLWIYERNKSKEDVDRVIGRLEDGH